MANPHPPSLASSTMGPPAYRLTERRSFSTPTPMMLLSPMNGGSSGGVTPGRTPLPPIASTDNREVVEEFGDSFRPGAILDFDQLLSCATVRVPVVERTRRVPLEMESILVESEDESIEFATESVMVDENAKDGGKSLLEVEEDMGWAEPLMQQAPLEVEEDIFSPFTLKAWENSILWDGTGAEEEMSEDELVELPKEEEEETKVIPMAVEEEMDVLDVVPQPMEEEDPFGDISEPLLAPAPPPMKPKVEPTQQPFQVSVVGPKEVPKEPSDIKKKKKKKKRKDDGQWALLPLVPANEALEQGEWEKTIVWDEYCPPPKPPRTGLILSRNDLRLFLHTSGQQRSMPNYQQTAAEALCDFDQALQAASAERAYSMRRSRRRRRHGEDYLDIGAHSLPAMQLEHRFFPTHLSSENIQQWHRPTLSLPVPSKIVVGAGTRKIGRPRAGDRPLPSPAWKDEQNPFATIGQLSASQGRVILMEYMEERPPLVSNVGMLSLLRTYYRPLGAWDDKSPHAPDGRTIILSPDNDGPFWGSIDRGQRQLAVENNMYRAPAFAHPRRAQQPEEEPPVCEFLLVRKERSDHWVLREAASRILVGQLQPRPSPEGARTSAEVQPPGSRQLSQHVRDRMRVEICRSLHWSPLGGVEDTDIQMLFPNRSLSYIRQLLKDYAEYEAPAEQGGTEGLWTKLAGALLPPEADLRVMGSPEDCCRYESARACDEWLRNQGVYRFVTPSAIDGVSSLLTAQIAQATPAESEKLMKLQEGLDNLQRVLEATSWSTTKTYLDVEEQRLPHFELKGDEDPHIGFPFVRPTNRVEARPGQVHIEARAVQGTPADLRKLTNQDQRKILLKFGLKPEEFDNLPRWDRVALVRRVASEAAYAGSKSNMTLFARGRRGLTTKTTEHQRKLAQKAWTEQVQALRSHKARFVDAQRLRRKSAAAKQKVALPGQLEQAKLWAMKREIMGLDERDRVAVPGAPMITSIPTNAGETRKKKNDGSSGPRMMVRRTKTVIRPDGTKHTEVTYDEDPAAVRAYEREQENNDHPRKRVVTRYDEKSTHMSGVTAGVSAKELRKALRQMDRRVAARALLGGSRFERCEDCGQRGHTFADCPYFGKRRRLKGPMTPAQRAAQKLRLDQKRYAKRTLDGERKALQEARDAEKEEYKALLQQLRARRSGVVERYERYKARNVYRHGSNVSKDELVAIGASAPQPKGIMSTRRRLRNSPEVALANLLRDVMEKVVMRVDGSEMFLHPLPKELPVAEEYYSIVKEPIWLSDVLRRLNSEEDSPTYISSKEFVDDLKKMAQNCHLYNDDRNPDVAPCGDALVEAAVHALASEERRGEVKRLDEVLRLETSDEVLISQFDAIGGTSFAGEDDSKALDEVEVVSPPEPGVTTQHPPHPQPTDDEDTPELRGLCRLLASILAGLRKTIRAAPFLHLPNPDEVPDYAEKIKPNPPLSVQILVDRALDFAYRNRVEMMRDFYALRANCYVYNGDVPERKYLLQDIEEVTRCLARRLIRMDAELLLLERSVLRKSHAHPLLVQWSRRLYLPARLEPPKAALKRVIKPELKKPPPKRKSIAKSKSKPKSKPPPKRPKRAVRKRRVTQFVVDDDEELDDSTPEPEPMPPVPVMLTLKSKPKPKPPQEPPKRIMMKISRPARPAPVVAPVAAPPVAVPPVAPPPVAAPPVAAAPSRPRVKINVKRSKPPSDAKPPVVKKRTILKLHINRDR